MAALNAVFDESLLTDLIIPDSNQYFEEAISKIPARFPEMPNLDFLRSFGLLTVYSLQRNNQHDLNNYLGQCHALIAEYGFHDESRWSGDFSLSDIDDHRRLFWCIYRLEIHSACVFGHVVRMPEAQLSVLYPRITPYMDSETQLWTVGWSYITDLFRLLEYAILGLRTSNNRTAILSLLCDRPSPSMLFESLTQLKASKSSSLVSSRDVLSDLNSNRCKYMAVQINCTEALATIMIMLSCHAPANEVMDFAEGFLREMMETPLIMFKIASSQIVHQLLGVGHMLVNASKHDNEQYQSEAKRLVASLGDLTKRLGISIPAAATAGDRLLKLADVIL